MSGNGLSIMRTVLIFGGLCVMVQYTREGIAGWGVLEGPFILVNL